MARDSFIQENAARRAAINRTRKQTGLVPPRPTPTAVKKPSPKKEAVKKAGGPSRQERLQSVNVRLQEVRAAQHQRMLGNRVPGPTPGSREDAQSQLDSFNRIFRPHWR